MEIAKTAVKALDGKKALNVKMLEITDLTILADYFVIATGTSNTHVKALADEVEFQLKEAGADQGHMEGYHSNNWILMDYHSVIIHVFQEKTREFYDLERLWRDAKEVDISDLID